MRKFSLLLASIAVAALVMATAAFTHPLAVRNGVVTDYSAGSTLTIRGANYMQTYAIRGNQNVAPSQSINGLGVGARVTVFAECFGNGRASGGAVSAAGRTGNGLAAGNGQNSGQGQANGGGQGQGRDREERGPSIANENNCVALFVVVRVPASANNGTAGSATQSGTTTPAATGTVEGGTSGTTTGTATPGAGTTSTETPTMTPTP